MTCAWVDQKGGAMCDECINAEWEKVMGEGFRGR